MYCNRYLIQNLRNLSFSLTQRLFRQEPNAESAEHKPSRTRHALHSPLAASTLTDTCATCMLLQTLQQMNCIRTQQPILVLFSTILCYRMLFPCRRFGISYHSLDDSKSYTLRLLGKPAGLPEVFGWTPRCPEGAREHVIFLLRSADRAPWRGPLVKARPLPSFL